MRKHMQLMLHWNMSTHPYSTVAIKHDYRLPSGFIKAGRQWGQPHPQRSQIRLQRQTKKKESVTGSTASMSDQQLTYLVIPRSADDGVLLPLLLLYPPSALTSPFEDPSQNDVLARRLGTRAQGRLQGHRRAHLLIRSAMSPG